MLKKIILLIVILPFLLFPVTNCLFAPTTVDSPSLELTHPVVYKDFKTLLQVAVLKTSESYVNGILQAAAVFKNYANWRVNLEIKVKFRDKDGFDLEDPWGWIPFPIESTELKTFKRLAPSDKAVNFTIIVQMAKR